MHPFIKFLGHDIAGTKTCLQAFYTGMKPAATFVDTDEDYARWVERFNHNAQMYIAINPIREGSQKFPHDGDVAHWCNEYIDLDGEKPSKELKGYNASIGELERMKPHVEKIKKWLADHGFKPGYCDFTGNGYRWILPIPPLSLDGVELDKLALKKKAFKEKIVADLKMVPGCGAGIDSVFDFKRVTGIPGTENVKMTTDDRPCRQREPFRGCERDEDAALRDYIMLLETDAPAHTVSPAAAAPIRKGKLSDLAKKDDSLAGLLSGGTGSYQSRSEAELGLACKLARYGFPEDEICDILIGIPGSKAGEKVAAGHEKWVTNTVANAVSWVADKAQKSKKEGYPSSERFTIVNDKGKIVFSPVKCADWLFDKSGIYFLTFADTDDVFHYDNGVYLPQGDKKIGEIVQETMRGTLITTHSVRETVDQIKRRSYTDRDAVDDNAYHLNLQNGVYDLTTNALVPHSPKYLSLSQMPVAYNADATCTLWDAFLEEVMPHEGDRRTIMEMFGHCLIGEYEHQKWFMLAGEGANGKGTTLDVLTELLGGKNVSAAELQDLENPFASAQMYGKMANIAGDLSGRYMPSTGMLKKLTGGDRLHAQFKGKQIFEFVNHASLIFAANEVPMTFDRTIAFMRRVVLIQFNYSIPAAKRIKKISKKFVEGDNLSGILNFALAGAKNLMENDELYHRFDEEEIMRRYVELSDSVATFVRECIEFTMDDDDIIPKKELYIAYKNWWTHKNSVGMVAPLKSSQRFSEILGNNPEMTEGAHRKGQPREWKWITIKSCAFEVTCEKNVQSNLGNNIDGIDGVFGYTPLDEKKLSTVEKEEKTEKNPGARMGSPPSNPSADGRSSKVLLDRIKSTLYQITSSTRPSFDPVAILMKFKTQLWDTKMEDVIECLDANLEELQIIKLEDGTYKRK